MSLKNSSTSYDAIDAYVERQMRRLHMPGVSLAIVEGDKIAHLRGFGRARPGGAAPSPQTPFMIGSVTKSFTALAVMQLAEAGKVELDAPVQRYLPWFRMADPQASAQMTVRHLLNQTSGLPGLAGETLLADSDSRPGAAERQARALSSLALSRPPGAAWEYNNANYSLLGLILEAAAGEPYAGYIQKHILAPLGMGHSYTSQAAAKENGLAMGHRYWFAVPFAAHDIPLPPGALAGGGLISASEDLARYLIALLNGGRCGDGQLLSSAGIAELHRGAADVHVMGLSLGQYGMGWFVDKLGGTKLVWHSGTLPDFGAYVALLPEQKKGVVLLFNGCHHWFNPVLTEVGMGAAALLAGEQPARVPFVRTIPWMLRGLLLIPALQAAGVAAALRLDRERRAGGGRSRGRSALLPLILNLPAALALIPLLGKRRGYLMLYMPDFSGVALACGGFALVWSVSRISISWFTRRARRHEQEHRTVSHRRSPAGAPRVAEHA